MDPVRVQRLDGQPVQVEAQLAHEVALPAGGNHTGQVRVGGEAADLLRLVRPLGGREIV